MHKKVCFLRSEKNKLKPIIEGQLKVVQQSIPELKISQYKKIANEEIPLPNGCDDDSLCEIKKYVDLMYYYSHKNMEIKKTKQKLLDSINDKVEKNEKPSTKYIRHLRNEEICPRNVVSIFESTLSRVMGINTNELTENIMVIRIYYQGIAKDMICNGYIYNNEKYIYLTSSAGQIRQKKVVFIKETIWNNISKTLMCGLTIERINSLGGMNINKFLAYLALCNSATELWEDFDIDKSIVVEDFETNVNGTFDYINDEDYSIKRIDDVVPVNHTDGCGMILPSLSSKNFMTRIPWVKGLLCVFDFRKFINSFDGNSKIKDIYGKEYDIFKDDIQIIFTKSQFKMWKFYNSWDEYKSMFKENQCQAGKCNIEEDKISTARINYQMLQTLYDMTDNEIDSLCKYSIGKLNGLSNNVGNMLSAFGVFKDIENPTGLQRALKVYPELLKDAYFKNTLTGIKNSMINNYKAAKLDIRGKYTFVIPDLFAFCQHLFLGMENPVGLLKDGQVFCRLYKTDKLDCLRSPHLFLEHAVRENISNEIISEWFVTDGIYTSCYDLISKILQFDVDGDKLLVVSEKKIISIAERVTKDIVPLYYNMRKAGAVEVNPNNIYDGLQLAFNGGNIGEISNSITKIWNNNLWLEDDSDKKSEALSVIKLLCMENNFTIDYAKTLYKPVRPKEINDKIREYTKVKVPYFFQFAKNKPTSKVEADNNNVINKIGKKFVSSNIRYAKIKTAKVDFQLMRNWNIEVDEDKYLDIISMYDEINSKYHYKLHMKDSDDGNLQFVVSEIKKDFSQYGNEQEVCNALVEYVYGSKKTTKNNDVLWYCYGDIIADNLESHLIGAGEYCHKCGVRFKKKKNELYCDKCDNGYEKIGTKTITCADCGKEFEVDSKDNESCRCKDCLEIHKKVLKKEQNKRAYLKRKKIK